MSESQGRIDRAAGSWKLQVKYERRANTPPSMLRNYCVVLYGLSWTDCSYCLSVGRHIPVSAFSSVGGDQADGFHARPEWAGQDH